MKLGVSAALTNGRIVPGDVEVADGRISAIGVGDGRGSRIAIPGLVDLQVNGFAGVDFLTASPSDYAAAGDALARSGVTAYQPTFITSPEAELAAALASATAAKQTSSGSARIIGVHVEGPFISPAYAGIHPVAAIRAPDRALLERLLVDEVVTMFTLAPELEGALDLIDLLVARKVVVSLGHTDATVEDADRAIAHGAKAVTHVFNAMRPLRHRDPGVIGRALAGDEVVVQMILDGQHVAVEAATIVWRCARGRLGLVTDAIAAAGSGDGDFRVGSVRVEVRDGRARLRDGTLAGNVGTLMDGVRALHRLGAPLEESVAAATSTPARLIGRVDIGSLAVGARADVVVLDDRLDVLTVLVGGRAATA